MSILIDAKKVIEKIDEFILEIDELFKENYNEGIEKKQDLDDRIKKFIGISFSDSKEKLKLYTVFSFFLVGHEKTKSEKQKEYDNSLKKIRKHLVDWKEEAKILNEDKKFINRKKLLQWLVSIVITIIIAFITINAVHPLFSPRVSHYEIIPQYIQSLGSDGTPHYYIIHKIVYYVDIPLFPWFNKDITLNLPLTEQNQITNIEFMCENKQDSLYLKVDYSFCDDKPFILVDNFAGRLHAKIKDNSGRIMSDIISVYLKEQINVQETPLSDTEHYWYSYSILAPEVKVNIASRINKLFGYGIDSYNNTYIFREVILKSETDMKIKGYRLNVGNSDEQIVDVCSEKYRLDTINIGDSEYVSIDLEPQEMIMVLVIIPLGYPLDEKEKEAAIIFPISRNEFCRDGWRVYNEHFSG